MIMKIYNDMFICSLIWFVGCSSKVNKGRDANAVLSPLPKSLTYIKLFMVFLNTIHEINCVQCEETLEGKLVHMRGKETRL